MAAGPSKAKEEAGQKRKADRPEKPKEKGKKRDQKEKKAKNKDKAKKDKKDNKEADEWNEPGREEADDFEADLWNLFGAAKIEEKPVAATPKTQVSELPSFGPEEDHVIKVPENSAAKIVEKLPLISELCGTQMIIASQTLRVSGESDAKRRASLLVAALSENRIPEGCCDVTTVHVLPEWVETWADRQALEEEFHVILLFEPMRGRSAFSDGQLAGLPFTQSTQAGHEIVRYQPVVVKALSAGGSRVKVKWCWDGMIREEDAEKLQAAIRVHILGRRTDRAAAVLKVLDSADQQAPGLMAFQMEKLQATDSDIFGCDGGPGAHGLQTFELDFEHYIMKKFLRQESNVKAKPTAAELVSAVSGCGEVTILQRATGIKSHFEKATKYSIVALGTRNQRWIAAELLRMLIFINTAKPDDKWIRFVPPTLLADCAVLKIPSQVMEAYHFKNTHKKMMWESKAVIVPIKEVKSSESEKKDASEVDDFIAYLYQVDSCVEFAVFGTPLQQKIATVNMNKLVESKAPGYVIRTTPQEQIDPTPGLGDDKIRLSYDFQEDASDKKAAILAAASGCYVAAVGNLLFLAGSQEQRSRARDYAHFMAPRSAGVWDVVPESRTDVIFTYVPDDASRSKWFKDQLKTLMEESKCCAFFDGCTNDSGDRRLLFAGHKVVHEEQRQQMSETLEKAEAAARAAVDWINGRYKSSSQEWWSKSRWKRIKVDHDDAKTSEPGTSAWGDPGSLFGTEISPKKNAEWSSALSSQSMDWSGWEAPESPSFGPHGSSAPETPMPFKAPQTPAGFGPHGASAPQTPGAPSGMPLTYVPEPASPAVPMVPGPATPAVHRTAPVPGPATPAANRASSVPGPATPAVQRTTPVAGPATPTVGPTQNATVKEEPALPPGWQRCISKTYNKTYYFNASLNKSQYERPT